MLIIVVLFFFCIVEVVVKMKVWEMILLFVENQYFYCFGVIDVLWYLKFGVNDVVNLVWGFVYLQEEYVVVIIDFVCGWDWLVLLFIYCWYGVFCLFVVVLIVVLMVKFDFDDVVLVCDLCVVFLQVSLNIWLIEIVDGFLGCEGWLIEVVWGIGCGVEFVGEKLFVFGFGEQYLGYFVKMQIWVYVFVKDVDDNYLWGFVFIFGFIVDDMGCVVVFFGES